MNSSLPKVLHEILGIPMIQRVLNTAKELNPRQIVTVLKHEAEQIISAVDIGQYTIQSDIPGTGSACLSGLDLINKLDNKIETVLVLSGDTPLITSSTLSDFVLTHQKKSFDISVLAGINENPVGYGRIISSKYQQEFFQNASQTNQSSSDCFDETKCFQIDQIVEEKDANDQQKLVKIVNSGIYLFDAKLLREKLPLLDQNNSQNEMYLTDVVLESTKENKNVFAYLIDDLAQTEGVNDRIQLAKMEEELSFRINRNHMLSGVTIRKPESVIIEDSVTIENDVTIEPNCYISGNTVIKSGANILMGSRIIDSIVDCSANIGPYAFLRPNAKVGENSKIGAFVEIKNSHIMNNSKVPHLSYVGDASIGENSNIGAGSIFANYDGRKKHQTSIGCNSKIGSKTIFVAPVKVGDNVYTGAGTLVRKDVPSNSLSISKNEQIIIDDWVTQNRS